MFKTLAIEKNCPKAIGNVPLDPPAYPHCK
nr:MAG TPA: hypothetical protein [Bacteriophage sp.]